MGIGVGLGGTSVLTLKGRRGTQMKLTQLVVDHPRVLLLGFLVILGYIVESGDSS